MKTYYEKPECQIAALIVEDVITDSINPGTGGMGGDNEGEQGGMPD